jgi:NarL family two-component system response regulator LiaR
MMDKLPDIVIIEDHPLMRKGLAAYFTGTGRWNVMGTASSLAAAKELLAHVSPDLLLMDIQLEDGWGLNIIPWIKTQKIKLPVLAVYSAFDNYTYISAALGLGVKAFVCKRHSEIHLENALQKALSGETYIDETAHAKLHTVNETFKLLSKREAEILGLVKNGLSNKQIAAILGIKRETVDNAVSCIYDTTGIGSRPELLRL